MSSMPSKPGLRLIVFDFDQTLSVYHVFKTLAGWGDSSASSPGLAVPKPYATSEEGQMRRIQELNEGGKFREAGGFATAAFGGERRVIDVRDQLIALQKLDIDMMICTKGLVGAVKKCLSDLDLLSFFKEVYGNIGDNYGKTAYDKEVVNMQENAEIRGFIGSSTCSNWQSKDKLIVKLRSSYGYACDEVVLVEDDPNEVFKARNVCRTVLVKEAKGMTSEHFDVLHRFHTGRSSSKNGSNIGNSGDASSVHVPAKSRCSIM